MLFTKGHGTGNDFVIIADPDGALDLTAEQVAALCDRRFGIGADGVLRVVISGEDPGVANWISTSGYPTGVIQGRWTECNSQPVPSLRKVPVNHVAQFLPATTPKVTAQERERIIRDRRSRLQQRPLW